MLTLSIISMLFIANGDNTPYNHWKSEREEIMRRKRPNLLLCLVEWGDRLAEAGHAQVGGVEAQLGGGHLGQQLFRIRAAPGRRSGGVNSFQQVVAYLVFATCRQVSLRKASLSSGLSTINCTTYLERWSGLQEHFNFLGNLTFFLGGPQWVCRLLPLDCWLPERLQVGKYSVGKSRAYLASLVTLFNIENIN